MHTYTMYVPKYLSLSESLKVSHFRLDYDDFIYEGLCIILGYIVLILFSRSQNARVSFFVGDHKKVTGGKRI